MADPPSRRPLDLADTAWEALALVHEQAGRQGVTLSTAIRPATGDGALLRRLTSNLLHHALRPTCPPKGLSP